MAKKQQKPEFPEETRICGIIFVMQMVAILSAVSIVYLTVASYTPSYRAIISSFEETSVICTTVLADDSVENCTWLSCFEWCLTKSSGLCMQIWVSVRNNGSELNFEQCNDRVEKSCTNEEFIPTHRHICRKDQCENLVGLFNCTKGTCVNVTAALNCTKFTSMDPQVSCKRRENCQHLDGFYTCAEGFCMRVLEPYTCERHCTEMDAKGKNLVLFSGDRIIMGNCLNAMERATQDLVWDPRTSRDVLFVSCSQVSNTSTGGLAAFDCVNASLVDPNALKNSLNLSQLMTVYHDPTVSHRLPPLNGYHVPLEQELTIYNRSRLLVNLEFCVNSLRDECKEFFGIYGRDGRDLRAQSRFPCFYSQEKNESVVTKFSRSAAIFEFTLTAAVPGGLFVFSCSCLVLCTKVVGIGPDAHMRLKGCHSKDDAEGTTAQTVELLPNNETNRNGKSSRPAADLNNSKPLSI